MTETLAATSPAWVSSAAVGFLNPRREVHIEFAAGEGAAVSVAYPPSTASTTRTGESTVERAAEHQPEVDRPDQQLRGHAGVGVGAKVTPFDAAGDDTADLGARADDRVAEGVTERRIDGDV